MKIEQYSVSLASEHAYSRQTSRSETLRAWVGDQRPDFEGANRDDSAASGSTRVIISAAARQALAAASAQTGGMPPQANQAEDAAPALPVDEEKIHDAKLDLLIRLVEALTGRKIKVMDAGEISKLSTAGQELADIEVNPSADQPQGWSVEYDYHEEIYEVETTSFMASGEIITADGKRVKFGVALQMHREFHQEVSVSFRAGDAVRKDPLVINFDGTAAQLSDMKFDFDIDADGKLDRISFVGPGSGFLVLDKNGNGRIDDGSELFGAKTGNGFAELAAYDSDGNGWIDENDSIFHELRTWTKDADGTDRLSTLAERGIGALYLGHAATPFDLKDNQNRQHGQILSTGIYLSENGGAGTIQQLDLFV